MRKQKKYFGQTPNKKQKSKKKLKSDEFLENDLLLDNDLDQSNLYSFDEEQELASEIFSADYIFNIIKKSNRPLRLDDILRHSKLTRRSKKEVLSLLKDLLSKGKIIRLSGASYMINEEAKLMLGKVIVQRSGAAFVSPLHAKNKDDDIFIPKHALKDAWNGDLVEVKILPKLKTRFYKENMKPEGMVERVVERGQEEFIVRLEQKAERQELKHIKPFRSRYFIVAGQTLA